MRKLIKRLLKSFIKIESIPFTENGTPKEFCTMYIFKNKVVSGIVDGKEEKDELCEYLGII